MIIIPFVGVMPAYIPLGLPDTEDLPSNFGFLECTSLIENQVHNSNSQLLANYSFALQHVLIAIRVRETYRHRSRVL